MLQSMKANCRKKSLKFGGFIAKLRATTAAHVPVGYQDETGFHFGVNAGDWFFLVFDSGGKPLFSAGFFTPTSSAAAARIGFWTSKTTSRDNVDNRAL